MTSHQIIVQERVLPLELLLQCCTTSILLSPDIEEPGDKVEVAFRRLDSDGDGYLILDDFVHVRYVNTKTEMRRRLRLEVRWPGRRLTRTSWRGSSSSVTRRVTAGSVCRSSETLPRATGTSRWKESSKSK